MESRCEVGSVRRGFRTEAAFRYVLSCSFYEQLKLPFLTNLTEGAVSNASKILGTVGQSKLQIRIRMQNLIQISHKVQELN